MLQLKDAQIQCTMAHSQLKRSLSLILVIIYHRFLTHQYLMVLYLIILITGQTVRFVVDYLTTKMVCSMNLMVSNSSVCKKIISSTIIWYRYLFKGSNILTGNETNFSGQLTVGQHVVIRGGQSYRITHLASKTEMHIQPAYKGVTASGVVATKTEDIKVPQSEWNIDKADGTGPSGFY